MHTEYTKIYVRLLDEDIEVYRPVDARLIEKNIYEILDTNINFQNSSQEAWEFLPNDMVVCENKDLKGDFNKAQCSIVAVSKISSQEPLQDLREEW